MAIYVGGRVRDTTSGITSVPALAVRAASGRTREVLGDGGVQRAPRRRVKRNLVRGGVADACSLCDSNSDMKYLY